MGKRQCELEGRSKLATFMAQPSGLVWTVIVDAARTGANDYRPHHPRVAAQVASNTAANADAHAGNTESAGSSGAAANSDERTCRWCYGEETVVPPGTSGCSGEGELVSPCACVGTQAFVHLQCLYEWQVGGTPSAVSSTPAWR
jgi:hypothetical protein